MNLKRLRQIDKKIQKWEARNQHVLSDERLKKISKDLKINKKELMEYAFRKLQRDFRISIFNAFKQFQHSFAQFEDFFLSM